MTKREDMTVNNNGKKIKLSKKIKMQAWRLGIHENFCSYFLFLIFTVL